MTILTVDLDDSLAKKATAIAHKFNLELVDTFKILAKNMVSTNSIPIEVKINRRYGYDLDTSTLSPIKIDKNLGHAVIPAKYDFPEDDIYEQFI